ncbi:hypothetical protein ABT369_39370 [Dactylosporangium sp. NPDC000244]|uniref:hypothetical protein n=1 Tax=Dactylosporangium sp. NPDC000244 TaxID=3154365 RepID=UPI00332FD5AC
MTPKLFTATWRDVYHHLVASGESMTVVGRVAELGVDMEWVATPLGLNVYDENGQSTATWYPEAGDALRVPIEIPAAPRHSTEIAKAAELLRKAAAGRLEYLARCPNQKDRDVLETEASTLRHAADVVEGDLGPLYGWLPAWRWTDEMNAQMREERS